MMLHLATTIIAVCLIITNNNNIIGVEAGKTVVSISGTQFYINGQVTNLDTPAAGLLLNSKMSQAIFDDENGATVGNWFYPDTHSWNATRNTYEFVSNVSLYNSKGLNAITVGLQGSNPDPSGQHNTDCIVTAFNRDGSLKSDWVDRLLQVVKETDQYGMVVILNLFDLAQESRLGGGDSTIFTAVQNVLTLLKQQTITNVILDIADACSTSYTHQILTPNMIYQMIKFVKEIAPNVPVSTSFPPGVIPPDTVIAVADFILLHATGMNRTTFSDMIKTLRSDAAYKRNITPIIVNQDSADISNFSEAVPIGISWGFYSQGLNNYIDGYCSPPINWGINTLDKTTFFDEVALFTN